MNKKFWQISLILLTSLSIGIGLGQGCSKRYMNSNTSQENNNSDLSNNSTEDYVLDPNRPTLSLIYSKQVLDHYVSCTGIGTPSDSTLSTWESKRGTVSADGSVLTITAPMFMATTTIVGDICQDLIEKDIINPRMFIGVDWSSPNLASDSVLQDAIRGLSLSCWQRNEEDVERQIILDSVKSEFGMSPSNNNNALLFLCTSILSSIDAMLM